MWIKIWSVVVKVWRPLDIALKWFWDKIEQFGAVLLLLVTLGLTIVLVNQLQLSKEQSTQTRKEAATLCVGAWEGREEVREMVLDASVASALGTNQSILDWLREVSPDADQITLELEDTLRRITAQNVTPQVEAVVARYPDPECDLDEANKVLEEIG